jgi:hypothetical protein
MSAKAEAATAAALRELGARTLKASTNAPKLHTLKLLNELGLDEEEDELELSMMEELATLVKNADGPAGDKVKYEYAVTVTSGGAGTHTGHTLCVVRDSLCARPRVPLSVL